MRLAVVACCLLGTATSVSAQWADERGGGGTHSEYGVGNLKETHWDFFNQPLPEIQQPANSAEEHYFGANGAMKREIPKWPEGELPTSSHRVSCRGCRCGSAGSSMVFVCHSHVLRPQNERRTLFLGAGVPFHIRAKKGDMNGNVPRLKISANL